MKKFKCSSVNLDILYEGLVKNGISSLQKFSELIYYTPGTVRRWVRGDSGILPETLQNIEHLLDIKFNRAIMLQNQAGHFYLLDRAERYRNNSDKIITNPDITYVQGIIYGLVNKGGYCPCQIQMTKDTKCPCKKFRETKECCCRLFVKECDIYGKGK